MATLRVLYGYSLSNGRKAANTFAVSSEESLSAVATALHDAWDDEIMPSLTDDVVHTVTRVATIDGTGFAEATGTEAGGETSDPISPNVAYLIKKSVLDRSRGGRWFLPGATEGQVDGKGQVSAAKQTELNSALLLWHSTVATDVGDVLMLDNVRPIPNSWVVNAFTCDPIASTQRRRLR